MSEVIEIKSDSKKVVFSDEEVKHIKRITEKTNLAIWRRLRKKYYDVKDENKKVPLEILVEEYKNLTKHYFHNLYNDYLLKTVKDEEQDK